MSFPSQDLCNVVPLVIAEKVESRNSQNICGASKYEMVISDRIVCQRLITLCLQLSDEHLQNCWFCVDFIFL